MRVTPIPTLHPELGPFRVTIETGDDGAAIVLTESTEFGATALALTAEQAKTVGLLLIRHANAVSCEAPEDAEVIELSEFASAR